MACVTEVFWRGQIHWIFIVKICAKAVAQATAAIKIFENGQGYS